MLVFRTNSNKSLLVRKTLQKSLIQLSSGIYSTDIQTEPASQIRSNIVKVLSYLRPGGIISHASALLPDFGMSDGFVVVTDPSLKGDVYIHELPGIKILATPGYALLNSDTSIDENISISSKGRAILENMESSRINKKLGRSKQLPLEQLITILQKINPNDSKFEGFLSATDSVNTSACNAWDTELSKFNKICTDKNKKEQKENISNPLYLAKDVDWKRLAFLEKFSIELKRGIHGNQRHNFESLIDFPNSPLINDPRFHNISFFESYFSNYIEGTEFEPEDAHEIATSVNPLLHEAKDGHDVRALYELYINPRTFLKPDNSAQELIDNLKNWHNFFGDHAEKSKIHPGQLKDKVNRVGGTYFTDPHQVQKTLELAWAIGQELLKEPFDHAIFRAISTVTIHPFLDGNGRMTRLASSNILARHGKIRPIIPTVFREDYILSLEAYSNGDCIPVIQMYSKAMDMTKTIPFELEFIELTEWLREKNAFKLPHQAKWGGVYIPENDENKPDYSWMLQKGN